MLVGFLFMTIGAYIFIKIIYDIKKIDGERIFVKKSSFEKDIEYRYKLFAVVLSFVLGCFSILNTILF